MSFVNTFSDNVNKTLYDISVSNINVSTINDVPYVPGGCGSVGGSGEINTSNGAGGWQDSGISVVTTSGNNTLTNGLEGTIVNQTYTTPYAIDMYITTGGSNLTVSSAANLKVGNSAGFGTANQVLTADGSGNCSWQNASGGGSIIGVPPAVCFVSSISGNDSNSGSIYSPVATLNQALTLCAPNIPNPGCVIYCFDASQFNENITVNGNVSIYAPYASLNGDPSGGTTITQGGTSAANTLTFLFLNNASSDAFTVEIFTGYLCLTVNTIFPNNSGGLLNTSTRTAVLNCQVASYVPISSAGSGSTWAISCPQLLSTVDGTCYSYGSNTLPAHP